MAAPDRDIAVAVLRGAPAVSQPVIKVRGREAFPFEDQLAVEEPLEIRLGGRSLAVTMRTPGEDEELVAGFLFSERIIEGAGDLDVIAHYRSLDDPEAKNVINVLLKGDVQIFQERLRRNFLTSSSCGLCGKVALEAIKLSLPPVESDFTIPLELLYTLEGEFGAAQATFARTGGLHAAGLFDKEGRLLSLREDIGRHNAVDKVIGHMLLSGRLPLDRHILMVSGRASFEIMQKALAARIPMVAAVSAPSSLAVQLASECHMTLVGFLRKGCLNIYTGSHRITP